MSDEPVSQPEDNVSRVEIESLQEQVKAARAERDRQIFEKSEIVAKANACARERDDLKAELASVLGERDQMIGDVVADHDKALADMKSLRDQLAHEKDGLAASLAEANRRADAAVRRADEAGREIARLRQIVDSVPSSDDLIGVLWAIISDKTRAGVAWVRSKIPADSPLLPYFDKGVELVATVGCTALKLTREFVVWATPRVIELSKQGVAKVEEMLAKK